MIRVSAARRILLISLGQSNEQGAAFLVGGIVRDRYISRYTGLLDPFPGCNNINQGGSFFPYLIDMGLERGVFFHMLNYAIGGASVASYTGRLGATITGGGDPSVPAAQGYMSPYGLSGGTSALVEGDAGFDPFGLLARSREAIDTALAAQHFDAVVSLWSNGETDAGTSSAAYQAHLESIGNYMLASGAEAHLIGLSSKGGSATGAQMSTLQSGVAAAITSMRAAGKNVHAGADMFARFGSSPPLYPEIDGTTYVHGTLRYQEHRARMLDDILMKAGY